MLLPNFVNKTSFHEFTLAYNKYNKVYAYLACCDEHNEHRKFGGLAFQEEMYFFDREGPHKLRREQLMVPGERALPANGRGTA